MNFALASITTYFITIYAWKNYFATNADQISQRTPPIARYAAINSRII